MRDDDAKAIGSDDPEDVGLRRIQHRLPQLKPLGVAALAGLSR